MDLRADVRIQDVSADAPPFIRSQSSILDRPLHTSFHTFVIIGFQVVYSDTNSSSSSPYGLYVGGYSNDNGSNAPKYGLSYMNAYNDVGNSNTNIGGRLTKFLIKAISPLTVILAAAKVHPSSLPIGSGDRAGEKSEKSKTGLVPRGKTRTEEKGTGAV